MDHREGGEAKVDMIINLVIWMCRPIIFDDGG